MKKLNIELPRIAASAKLVDQYINQYSDILNGDDEVFVFISGHDCEITTSFFTDYFRSELLRFKTVKQIIVSQGPDSLRQIQTTNNYTVLDFVAMASCIEKNVEKIENEGIWASSTRYEIKEIDLLAVAILERGFRLERAETESE